MGSMTERSAPPSQGVRTCWELHPRRWRAPLFWLFAATRGVLRILGKYRQRLLRWMGWQEWYDYSMWWQLHAPRLARIGLPSVAPELWVMRQLQGVVAVDIGAYVGYFAILLSRTFQNVYAFEPHPLTRDALIRNLRANKVDNVTVLPVAVGTTAQESALLYVGQESTHSLLHSFAGGHVSARDTGGSSPRAAKTIKVRVRTLAELFPDQSLDLVKVDVEGAEFDVVNGSKTIMPQIKRWLIEVHYSRLADLNQRRKQMQATLKEHGYRTRWLDDFHIYAERQEH